MRACVFTKISQVVCNVERLKTLLLLCCRKSEDHRSEDDTTYQPRERWLVAEATQTKSCKNFSELIIYRGEGGSVVYGSNWRDEAGKNNICRCGFFVGACVWIRGQHISLFSSSLEREIVFGSGLPACFSATKPGGEQRARRRKILRRRLSTRARARSISYVSL